MAKKSKITKKSKGRTVYFWYGAGHICGVTFLGWRRTLMGNGREDTNKIGTGAFVESDYLFSKLFLKKIPHGVRRGQYVISPYTPIYRTFRSAQLRKNEMKRPNPNELKPISHGRKR